MRTTITLDPEVEAGAEQLRRTTVMGLSDAINVLAKAGLDRGVGKQAEFRQRTVPLALKIDVSNVEEALDFLEGEMRR
jgi:hypothetical protein